MRKDNFYYQQRNVFAKTLYYEGGSTDDIIEVLYIGYVIRNRVDGKRWFGRNYIEVCLKKYQFSCWNGKTLDAIEKIDLNGRRKWKMCLMVSEYIMELPKKEIPREMKGVCYYYNPLLVCPKWAYKGKLIYPEMELAHIFLKLK